MNFVVLGRNVGTELWCWDVMYEYIVGRCTELSINMSVADGRKVWVRLNQKNVVINGI